jgi:hypothetical protein
MHNKINKMFLFNNNYGRGKASDTEIIGYNSPNYKGYISSPTKMQVLQCYFCNYIYLYCVLKTLKNAIKLTCC